jgi:tartrate dehydrogenase/decarboxylase / D-malate dehydrogenase
MPRSPATDCRARDWPRHRRPSRALMPDFLGHREAHDAILQAIEQVLREGPRTRDLGGRASTVEVGKAIAALLE